MAFTIYIHTKGRLGKQATLNSLSESPHLLARTVLVVENSELEAHEDLYGLDCQVIGHPCKGLSATRQWIVDNCPTPYLFMIDDDMRFFKRIGDTVKLQEAFPDELEQMFSLMMHWLDSEGLAVVGLSARGGNNNVPHPHVDATRQTGFHGLCVESFKGMGLRFDKIPLMQDFYMLLDLLTQGCANRVLYTFCWNQIAGSGASGGCSTYRTAEMMAECANKLKEAFPDFVTVVQKEAKSGWKGLTRRTDVRIQWKKAFAAGKEEREWGI